jgi:hypothetical protein
MLVFLGSLAGPEAVYTLIAGKSADYGGRRAGGFAYAIA